MTNVPRAAVIRLAMAIAGGMALLPARGWLRHAEARHAALSTLARDPVRAARPPIDPAMAFGGNEGAAAATLAATVRDLATREGALIEQVAPRPAPATGLVARHAIVSGNARAMLRFVEAIDARAPVIRLFRYRLATNASGQSLRLDADLVMAFHTP